MAKFSTISLCLTHTRIYSEIAKTFLTVQDLTDFIASIHIFQPSWTSHFSQRELVDAIRFNAFMLGPYSVQRIHARPLFIGSTFPPYCFICSYFIALAKFGRLEHKTIVITKMASSGRSMNYDFVCYLGHNWLSIRSRDVSLLRENDKNPQGGGWGCHSILKLFPYPQIY